MDITIQVILLIILKSIGQALLLNIPLFIIYILYKIHCFIDNYPNTILF